jgi:hypothetical protein
MGNNSESPFRGAFFRLSNLASFKKAIRSGARFSASDGIAGIEQWLQQNSPLAPLADPTGSFGSPIARPSKVSTLISDISDRG